MSLLRSPLAALVVAFGLGLGACATDEAPSSYRYNRWDYQAFRGRVGSLPEPNFLPFLAHNEVLPDGEPALVLCRWPNRRFPLRFHIESPVIPEAVQDEFSPKRPEDYVQAVRDAFAEWEREIGRPVRFQEVEDPAEADVRVRLEAFMRESPEGLYGGRAGDGSDLCRVLGPASEPDRVDIRFSVDSITLYIVDPMGLLTSGQVERIAMHEIGHVLGASGQHSPLGGDLMYRVANDSRIEPLSQHDANSFRALYKLPPGSIYVRINERHSQPMVEARRGPPRLGPEVEDPRFDVRVRFPKHWQTIRTPRGWIAVDGLSWDYDASVQVIGVRGSPEALMARYGAAYLNRGEFVQSDVIEVDDRTIPRIIVRRGPASEVTSIVSWSDDRVLLVVADSLTENFDLYRPWFQGVLLSIEPLSEPTTPTAVGAGDTP